MTKFKLAAIVVLASLGACASDTNQQAQSSFEEWAARKADWAMPQEAAPASVAPMTVSSDSPAALGKSGTALRTFNDPDFKKRFAESYLAATDVEPGVTLEEREQMMKVLDFIAADDAEAAAALIQEKSNPASSAVFDYTLANIRFQQERLDESLTSYEAAVGKFANFRRAWKNIGLIHVRQGRHKEAITALSRVIELGGGDAISYGLLGFSYSNIGNDLAAESAYRMANLLDPTTMDWKMGMARSFFKQRRYADAIALLGDLIEAEPDRADLWLLQANAWVGLGDSMKAAENFEIVDRLGGSTVDSLNLLGDIYVNEELFDVAVERYLRALEKDPSASAERAVRAAKVLTSRAALDESGHLVERISTLRGDSLSDAEKKDLLKIRARIAVAKGADDEEARVLEEIVKIDPLDGEALILLGQQAGRKGEVEKAIFYYERAESLESFEADAKVRHAQLLVSKSRYAEALPLLRRAQAIKPRDNIQEYLEQVERVAGGR